MPNELIYAMSTKGEIRIEEFYDLLNSLTLRQPIEDEVSEYDIRSKVIRILESLGYCEFDFNNRKVHMCPPGLVRLPTSGLPKVVLVGARIPKLVKALKMAVKKNSDRALFLNVPQKKSVIEIPPLICIEADNTSTIRDIAFDCNINANVETPAAWMLSMMSKAIQDIKEQLSYVKRDFSELKMRKFDTRKLIFTSKSGDCDICLTEHRSPITKQFTHLYWKGDKGAEIGRDWGRYLALAEEGKKIVIYDKKLRYFAVPRSVPLPNLLARALTFCTGTPPFNGRTAAVSLADIPKDYSIDIYSGVPESIASLISTKIGQELQYRSLDENEEEIVND